MFRRVGPTAEFMDLLRRCVEVSHCSGSVGQAKPPVFADPVLRLVHTSIVHRDSRACSGTFDHAVIRTPVPCDYRYHSLRWVLRQRVLLREHFTRSVGVSPTHYSTKFRRVTA